MSNITAISLETHRNKFWRRNENYDFARGDSFCPIALMELSKAIMSLPVCFIRHEDRYQLVLLQSLVPNSNLALSETGMWDFEYIPANYRTYPFLLATDENGEKVLCIHADDQRLTDDDSAESFFTAEDEPSPIIKDILDFLVRLASSNESTKKACGLLDKYGLIVPWPVRVEDEGDGVNVEGLYKINEANLIDLTAGAMLELRDSGALTLAYGQLFSMQNLSRLGKRMKSSKSAVNIPAELDMDSNFLEDSGSIDFSNL